jgi:signal transduction histidine kinase
MLTPEARAIIQKSLELFAIKAEGPIEFYEHALDGSVQHRTPVGDSFYPRHCQAIWRLAGGRGRRLCEENMCGRATATFHSAKPATLLCHAGLTNETLPIILAGSVNATIQYGALRLKDETPEAIAQRYELHHQLMKRLHASPQEQAEIAALFNQVPSPTRHDWDQVRATLPDILKQIVALSAIHLMRQRQAHLAAYHEVQQHLGAASHDIENLQYQLGDDSPLTPKLKRVRAKLKTATMVMHSVSKGEFLQKKLMFTADNPLRFYIDEALSLCAPIMERKGLKERLDLQHNGDIAVEVSPEHIQIALNNLMYNAVKYSYRTSTNIPLPRFIHLSGRLTPGIVPGYELVIGNYGVGIMPDEYRLIFREGYRGKLTMAEYKTGSGYGLALAYRIIKEHQGKIQVVSEPVGDVTQRGDQPYLTTFTIWLPLRQGSANGDPTVVSEKRLDVLRA